MNKIIYIQNYTNYLKEIEEKEIMIEHTPIIINDNKALFVTLEDLTLDSIEVLGSYEEVFADTVKDTKYRSVYDYTIPNSYEDEDGNIVEYDKPKEIGMFAIEEEIVPDSITMRQCRLYLLSVELLDDIDALVTVDKASQIEWEYATTIERNNHLVSTIKDYLQLTDKEIDCMFIKASKL